MRTVCALAACGLVFSGCGPDLPARAPIRQKVEADPWAAVSRAPTGPPAYLGNGRFGVRLGHSGFGLDNEGVSLPCFLLDRQSLVRVPNLSGLELAANGRRLGSGRAADYESRLDFRTGKWTLRWRETVRGGRTVTVRVETVADPELTVLAQRLMVSADRKVRLTLRSGVRERGAALTGEASFERFAVAAEGSRVSEGEEASLGPFEGAVIRVSHRTEGEWDGVWTRRDAGYEFRGAVGEEAVTLERVALCEVKGRSALGRLPTFNEVARRAEEEWARRWETDIEIEGPTEDQQAIRSFLFYLYMSGNAKLPPMALSSDKYKGHRFWDGEAWTLPVYALISTGVARSATQWRLDVYHPNARIPWETGADGSDLTPPEFQDALHAAGWVCWWLERAMAFDLVEPAQAKFVQAGVARDFYYRAVRGGGKAELLGVIGPDEGKRRDNDLVTNLLAKFAAETGWRQPGGPTVPSRWLVRRFGTELVVPTAEDGLPATYDNDHLMTYQQTAALLALYPLEWPFEREVRERMFDRYKGKVSDAGPAMSDSVHAVIAARLGRPEEAYEFWKKSWVPFIRPEQMLFSERRVPDQVYFATGAAGSLQSVIYGFLGVRVEKAAGAEPGVSKPLKDGYQLSVRPQLPAAWKSITFRNVRLPGGTYTIRATHETVSIIEEEG
ncbi:MAG: glycoside hydrolase family 65 protein [Armatimonadetes bacterium]|nr:glycoside hydrolase family 65 protein [Armatimonadota bacterium]